MPTHIFPHLFLSQLLSLLFVWLRSYRRTPFRLLLIIISMAATCLTFATGLGLAGALEKIRPAPSPDSYLIMAVGAGTEARSFIPLASYERLRTAFSAMPTLHGVSLVNALVLPADIVLDDDEQNRLPTMLRGIGDDARGVPHELRLLTGRAPRIGQRELLLSPALHTWLYARGQPSSLRLAQVEWSIVGVAERSGAANQVEMYSTLASVQQQFQITDILSSVCLTLDAGQLAAARQVLAQLRDARFQLIPLSSYGGDFIDQLYWQLTVFWCAFLAVALICTGFGIHTIALALEAERDKVRQILFRIGFTPMVIRAAEIAEGSVLGVLAAGGAIMLFGLLWQGLPMQSLLPSGAVSLRMHMSLRDGMLTLLMGAVAGAIIFSWRRPLQTKSGF